MNNTLPKRSTVDDTLRIATKLSLGDSGQHWPGYVTAGLSGQIRMDITKPPPGWMMGRYEFIWSERMLEHISVQDLDQAFRNIALLLKKGAACRMCLPICFWGTPKINMVRQGNEGNCERYGHVTWFTYEGYGPVTPACMGASDPPVEILTLWHKGLHTSGLTYRPVRHYRRDGSLFVDRSVSDPAPTTFLDQPEVEVKRPDSLIFDLIRH